MGMTEVIIDLYKEGKSLDFIADLAIKEGIYRKETAKMQVRQIVNSIKKTEKQRLVEQFSAISGLPEKEVSKLTTVSIRKLLELAKR